jgi:3-deoxy-7-phosphoheptulonate synthase
MSPGSIRKKLPLSPIAQRHIEQQRRTIVDILSGKDRRLLLIIGPCAVQSIEATIEYGKRLAALSQEIADQFFVVMRAYIEKSRTAVDWKGFLYDNDHQTLGDGLVRARQLFLDLAAHRIPIAMEFLDPLIADYVCDLVTWGCIGARTVQSPIHRELASRLPMPVGIKNSTDGSMENAICAITTARASHRSFGISKEGSICEITSPGNPDAHLVLRGGVFGPNFRPPHIQKAADLLRQAGISPSIVVDCSHGNSQRRYDHQPHIFHEVVESALEDPLLPVRGLMIESFLEEGAQEALLAKASTEKERERIRYGSSRVDGCLGWEATAALLRAAYEKCSRKRSV